MRLILASASPRRAAILSDAGIPFEVLATATDETRRLGESAEAMARRLAESKARAAVARLQLTGGRETAFIVGADTVVEIDGDVLGKPGSEAGAREMLRRLSGRSHSVLTGLAVFRLPEMIGRCEVERTTVRFALLSDEEIDEYAATIEPLDKAGGYAIQGIAGRYVERMEGCYFNVVGLPLARLYRILRELDWKPDSTNHEREQGKSPEK
jgi:septum formation protein